ncbi:threonine dehydratase catabolic [Verticillium alfalfae VaMs.102]|uniref:Threonine dehydratase catabolic n=1 Tax=Verticillium alfalfae (strain VaMs.102 / ATCC MYA-4576 / FGSC 10136) TaxID=526221 RepID=C9SES5_VERA1|nr:threonine dehydratase catabolic [Verticillium alfalfae VaMs.102]EEY16668.1 threonine dehydratase catabolic [Verticillium alfalfae VaMs.102]
MSATPLEIAASAVQARQRIRQHIYQTPLIPAKKTGINHGAKVFFKAENFQLTGSFKLRGAMSKMSNQTGNSPLITASSGNHGIGSAKAASILHKSLTVVLPETVIPSKRKKIEVFGVKVILYGSEAGKAEQHAQKLATSGEYTYVSPYNDADIVAGQATIGLEILEQCDHVDNVFVSMGGGGLISGIGSVLKAFSPRTKIFGVSATNSKTLADSIVAGEIIETDHLPTLAEGVAGGIDEDSITLPLASAVVDQVIECNEVEIAAAMRSIAFDETMIVEGSAGLALAGFDKVAHQLGAQTSIILLCGANVDANTIKEVLYRS